MLPRLARTVSQVVFFLLVGVAIAYAGSQSAVVEVPWDERLARTLTGSLSGGRQWVAGLAAFLGGLVTAFTPCVYPLIPITVRYFGGMNRASRRQVIGLAHTYVAGMVLLYAGLGTALAASGMLFGAALANPFVNFSIALLCVVMGVSILGAFTLQLPAEWNTRLSQVGGKSFGGALLMGLVSGLIAAPCTGPVTAVILAVAATSGKILTGFVLMTCFGIGLGTPFLILAVFAGELQKIPAAGPWMDLVKVLLSTAVFVVAAYFLRLAWPAFGASIKDVPYGGLLGLIFIVAGLGSGAFFLSLFGRPAEAYLKIGAVVLLTGGLVIGLFGSRVTTANPGVAGIEWASDHEVAWARARAENRPMIVDFTAEWCLACKELEHRTFVDERVRAEMGRFVTVRVDATELTPAIEALFSRYGVQGLPAVAFVDSKGAILMTPRVTGFMSAAQFVPILTKIQ